MMMVRKFLDHIFTQDELLALDDALPGQRKTREYQVGETINMKKSYSPEMIQVVARL